METVLQAIGALVVAALAIAATVYAALWTWLRLRYGRDGIALLASDDFPTPARITLRRDTAPAHFHPEAFADVAEALCEGGFFPVGHFSIDELPMLSVQGLFHPGERLLATVCDHPGAPGLYELSAHYSDHRVVRATNNPLCHPSLTPPEWETHFERDLHPVAALGAMRARDDIGERRVVNDEHFVELYERTWARSMDWLLKQENIPDDLIHASAATFGVDGTLGPEDFASARENLGRFLASELERACIKNFLRTGAVTAAHWERLRKRVFVIHERMSGETVLRRLARCVSERQIETLQLALARHHTLRGVHLFETLNQSLPAAQQVRRLGVVREPVLAHIFSPP